MGDLGAPGLGVEGIDMFVLLGVVVEDDGVDKFFLAVRLLESYCGYEVFFVKDFHFRVMILLI